MNEEVNTMGLEAEIAPPLHLQRLERSLNVQPFLNQITDLFHERVRYAIYLLNYIQRTEILT